MEKYKKVLNGETGFTGNSHQVAKDAFDNWKKGHIDHNYYKSKDEYNADIQEYINALNDNVKNTLQVIIESNNLPDGGNKDLKDQFDKWKVLSKENFYQISQNKIAKNTYISNKSNDDAFIKKNILEILNNPNLGAKPDGNSELIKNLKQISQNEYDKYLAKS